jgi:hypothetical protein
LALYFKFQPQPQLFAVALLPVATSPAELPAANIDRVSDRRYHAGAAV